MNKLATSLADIKGVGPSFIEKLGRLKIRTVKDLLYHLPFRYQDFSVITPIKDLKEGQTTTIFGTISSITMSRTMRKRMYIIRASVQDDTGKIKVIWFNQKYIITMLKKGMSINLSGKVSIDKTGKLYLSSPVFEIINKDGQETRHTGRIVPIYPETRGITSRAIRLILSKIVDFIKDVEEFLPESVLVENNLPYIYKAFKDVHFPKSIEDAEIALDRFSFQDLFLLQLLNANEQYKLTQHNAKAFKWTPEQVSIYLDELPFKLTVSQKKSLFEILQDISKSHPTSRLLQGDVGSGKTIVVAIASLIVANGGGQVVFMAPTEVLASQHYQSFKSLFSSFSSGIGLLTSSQSVAFFGDGLERDYKKKELLDQIKNGSIKIIVGTHSVIQKSAIFKNLSFVIIDEQHRFGVKQRAELATHKTSSKTLPHFLSMSATPIPRTLALTVFGDLDVSIIDELPKDRKKIITKVVPSSQHSQAYSFIKGQIEKGRQAFVVCPRIEPPEDDVLVTRKMMFQLDIKSVKEEYEKLSKKIFPDLSVEMLHGRMKPSEKEKIMNDFKNKKINILVSTSVIEVGVDVPNASIMLVEGAERFGLAQLYQFRGRVGRGKHQSYCFLFTESRSATTKERLNALVRAKNGFELAEMDLKFRGPGQFLGKEQTGLPDLAMKALKNPQLVKLARDTARDIIEEDPTLLKYPYLSTYLELFQRDIHRE